jgi:hypothetical protein
VYFCLCTRRRREGSLDLCGLGRSAIDFFSMEVCNRNL